jgi:hypothetical protein
MHKRHKRLNVQVIKDMVTPKIIAASNASNAQTSVNEKEGRVISDVSHVVEIIL